MAFDVSPHYRPRPTELEAMIRELVYIDFREAVLPKGIDKYDSVMPTPFVEIDQNKYLFLTHDLPRFVESRQIILPGWRTIRTVQIAWYSDYGIAVVRPSDWKLVNGEMVYTDPILYYRIGCEHDWQEIHDLETRRKYSVSGACHHLYQCPKCLSTRAEDSSD